MRKPISSAVLGGMLIVICDDGSVWELDPSNGWVAREPIPGTREAESTESSSRGGRATNDDL